MIFEHIAEHDLAARVNVGNAIDRKSCRYFSFAVYVQVSHGTNGEKLTGKQDA